MNQSMMRSSEMPGEDPDSGVRQTEQVSAAVVEEEFAQE